MKKLSENTLTGFYILLLCIVAMLLMTGCGGASYRGESTTDRMRENCERVGGEWTSLGCVFTVGDEG